MVKFMHQEITRATKVVVRVACYVALNYDGFYIVNNQTWLSIHYYVVQTRQGFQFSYVWIGCLTDQGVVI